MIELRERVTRLETQLELMAAQITHIDICVDSLKRTVWQATGAIAIVILLVNVAMRHV